MGNLDAFVDDYLPLAARTATTDGADLQANGAKGLMVVLRVSAAGTSNIDIALSVKETLEGNYARLNAQAVQTGTGTHVYIFDPRGLAEMPPGAAADTIGTNVKQMVAIPLPQVFRVTAVKGDASSWTFGVQIHRLY